MAGTVKVVLRKCRKQRDGRYPLAIRLTRNRQVKYIFTGYSAQEREWNGKYPNYLNNKHPNQSELNNHLIQIYSTAISQKLQLEQQEKPFTVADLYSKLINKRKSNSLFGLSKEVMDQLITSGRVGSAECHKTALNAVKRFNNGKDLCFEDINYKWLKDFEAYHYSRGNTPVSLGVYLRSIRSLYNRAIKYNLISESHYPFGRNKYTIPTGPSRKRAISKADILKIEQLVFQPYSYLWHAKNYFLFSFYTMGMNWSDMAHLKMKNIVNNRIEYIRLKTKRKTVKGFSIGINAKIQSILSFYTKNKNIEDFIFPIIKRNDNPTHIRADVKNKLRRYNQNLERIGNQCGIKEKLTSYVSRHSWATIAKKSGIDIGIISDALGHNDTQVTRVYLDSFGSEEIDKANDRVLQ
jgi:integrase/recombinase XerD